MRRGTGNNPRSRKWMITIWKDEDIEYIKQLKYQYLIISDLDHTQDEQEHRHAFIQFSNPRTRGATQTAHWEIANDISGSINYCKDKGENFFEDGELQINTNNGDDWKYFTEACKTQTPDQLIDGPYSRLYARFRNYAGEVCNQFRKLKTIDGELQNEWLWGDPGSGKTKSAWERYPNLYVKNINKWWDGYNNQEVVLLDDWDPNHKVLASHLKQWSDRYPFRGETKGSSMMIRPQKIIVTSNYSPEQCFDNEEDVKAIRRRFQVRHYVKNLNQAP